MWAIGTEKIGSFGDEEIGLGFDASDVFGLQQGRANHLAQLFVGVGGNTGVAEGVFIPEEVGFIAGAADVKRVGEGAQLAGGIEH
jgi:hypothetical protein